MPVIAETPRLILRTFDESDLDDLAAISADMRVMRYMGGQTLKREQVADRMAYLTAYHERTGWAMWIMQDKSSGRYAGDCGMIPMARHGCDPRDYDSRGPQIELGYRVHPDFQGMGYAREAATAALRVGFEERGLNRILATTDTENIPSQAVLLAIGMRCIGQNESYFFSTSLMYEMTAREFSARRDAGMA